MCILCNPDEEEIMNDIYENTFLLCAEDCESITTISLSSSLLNMIDEIEITNCSKLKIIPSFPKIHNMYLDNLPNLEEIQYCEGMIILYYKNCPKLDFSKLHWIKRKVDCSNHWK